MRRWHLLCLTWSFSCHAGLTDAFLGRAFDAWEMDDLGRGVFVQLAQDQEAPAEERGPSLIYATDFRLSKNVFFHPYNPNEEKMVAADDGVCVLKNSLSLCLPAHAVWDQVPPALKAFVSRSATQISVRLVTQNLPWKAGTPLLVRPHYLMNPLAPTQRAGYNVAQTFEFMTQALDGKQVLGGGGGISTHSGTGNLIVLSPASPGISGLDLGEGNLFWSATVFGGPRGVRHGVLTLHWVVGADAQQALDALTPSCHEVGQLSSLIQAGPFSELVKTTLGRLLASDS